MHYFQVCWLRSHFALKVTVSVLQVTTLSVWLRNGDQNNTLWILDHNIMCLKHRNFFSAQRVRAMSAVNSCLSAVSAATAILLFNFQTQFSRIQRGIHWISEQLIKKPCFIILVQKHPRISDVLTNFIWFGSYYLGMQSQGSIVFGKTPHLNLLLLQEDLKLIDRTLSASWCMAATVILWWTSRTILASRMSPRGFCRKVGDQLGHTVPKE
jgi:hypothetical protein